MVTVDFDHTFRIYWEMSDKNISISFFFLYILTRQKKKNPLPGRVPDFSFGKYDHYNYQLLSIKLNTALTWGLANLTWQHFGKVLF